MLIEITRKLVGTDASMDVCVICGNDFDLRSVYAAATGDQGQQMGEMCPVCLEYLNRRKEDGEDPTRGNWPVCGWPTPELLQRLRSLYPEPMFGTEEELLEATTDRAAEERIFEAAKLWRMEREYELG